jgi:hypothetical protein
MKGIKFKSIHLKKSQVDVKNISDFYNNCKNSLFPSGRKPGIETVEVTFFVTGLKTLQILGVEMFTMIESFEAFCHDLFNN